jgi:protein TonB
LPPIRGRACQPSACQPLAHKPTCARRAPPPPAQADGAPARAAYLHRLWLRIMEHRPAGLGLAGTVTLGFRLDGEGRLAGARVTRSSGIALLDRAALQALRRAAPFPAPAPGMESGGEDFEVEIRFGCAASPCARFWCGAGASHRASKSWN